MRGLILATASVIALGVGGAGVANAWSGGHSGSSMGPNAGTSSSKAAPMHSSSAHRTTGGSIKQAQQILQRDGLYRGRIDGIDGSKTRHAIAQFQKQNGLRVTARLDRKTMASLTGQGAVGSGATMPPRTHSRMTTGQAHTPAPPQTGTSSQGMGTGTNAPNNTNTGTPTR
jgi:peptidoglycan hydrolase-like protein with peptidoglycan-binding domain